MRHGGNRPAFARHACAAAPRAAAIVRHTWLLGYFAALRCAAALQQCNFLIDFAIVTIRVSLGSSLSRFQPHWSVC
jgi:hypothetical protein